MAETVIVKGAFEFKGSTYGTISVNGTTWLGKNLDLETPDSWCYSDENAYCVSEGRLFRWEAAKKACEALGKGGTWPRMKSGSRSPRPSAAIMTG
ncbi:MAG: hypothetical protein IPJ40_02715 [Saprospirales bacterium]|nr:hypothetical protein [Saprospirales bacterium]